MAKTKQQTVQTIKSKKQRKDMSHLHFAMTSKNYIILGVGIAIIILGYIFMNENSVSGFLPMAPPIMLIFGYCVVVPFGILYRDKSVNDNAAEEVKEIKQEVKSNVSSKSSNIKTA